MTKIFATIALRGLDRSMEASLLAELRVVCLANEKRTFGLSYECETDDIRKIKKVLTHYEKHGLDITHEREGDCHVYVARPWLGFRRTLSTGQVQISRHGRILTYASRQALLADSPLFEKETFANFERAKAASE